MQQMLNKTNSHSLLISHSLSHQIENKSGTNEMILHLFWISHHIYNLFKICYKIFDQGKLQDNKEIVQALFKIYWLVLLGLVPCVR